MQTAPGQCAQALAADPDGKFYHVKGRTLMARSKSSKRWLAEHFDDPYVRQAQKSGWRSRSAFKLLEMDEKYHLIRPGSCIVDLGSAPGGWSQVARSRLGRTGRVIGLDVLDMEPLQGVEFIQGDFTEPEPLARLEAALAGQPVDLVLSDMAPNMSGMEVTDQAKAMYLAELALTFVQAHLKPGGDFVVKLFHGQGFDAFVASVRPLFEKVMVRKPGASRSRSREVYLLAQSRKVK
jgi:23S rRNA (uridine2552-2'-O)-methyltransferase